MVNDGQVRDVILDKMNILSSNQKQELKKKKLTVEEYLHKQDRWKIPDFFDLGYDKYRVVEVGDSLFEDCSSLTNIEFPKTIKKIGNKSVKGCSSLKKIKLPETLEEIGNSAFEGCTSINSIEIPINVKKIGQNAFKGIKFVNYKGNAEKRG